MNITAIPSPTLPVRPQAPRPKTSQTEESQSESLDSYLAADAGLVLEGLGVLAAPAVVGAAFGAAGIAAAAVGGALLDTFVPDSTPSESSSKYSGAVTLAALAATGAVIGAPGVLAAAGMLGTCGLLLTLVDTFGG